MCVLLLIGGCTNFKRDEEYKKEAERLLIEGLEIQKSLKDDNFYLRQRVKLLIEKNDRLQEENAMRLSQFMYCVTKQKGKYNGR